jgi:energy-coupling factor transporter ATP-binding protein EcfA2
VNGPLIRSMDSGFYMLGKRLWASPRITVVGTSGSGKTTFARQLAGILNRQHIELDTLYWGPSWTPRPEFASRVESAISGDSWVLDGNYGSVRNLVWSRSSAIVWLNYPFRIVISRALVRTVRRLLTREVLFAGNVESFRISFLSLNGIPAWVLRTYWRRRREYPLLLSQEEFGHLELLEIRTPAKAVDILRAVAAA